MVDLTVTPAAILLCDRIDTGGNAVVANKKIVRALNQVGDFGPGRLQNEHTGMVMVSPSMASPVSIIHIAASVGGLFRPDRR
jgi:hypothetical protein